MKLIITRPDNVSWQYELVAAADDLLRKFASGELDRIMFSEESPSIQRDWPMRFELSR
jgi:hypothetical protein